MIINNRDMEKIGPIPVPGRAQPCPGTGAAPPPGSRTQTCLMRAAGRVAKYIYGGIHLWVVQWGVRWGGDLRRRSAGCVRVWT